jgi:4-amino-4-deoxy-L-arabinose transferase-like glycosyltransferase
MISPNHAEWEAFLQKWFLPLLIPAILVNAGGLFIPILEPDGSLYATISKTIAHSGDFVNLMRDGKDWLDKPHFPFWMAALSFRVLGVNAFAYKFPALLFWSAGAFYTWRLALSLYGKPIAQLSTLIYVSAAHLVISNNDVRAEPYLTGLIIGSVYHFYKASRVRPGLHLLAGSILAACACMTKGPFVLITIGAGFVLDWTLSGDWQQFRNPRWLIAIVLTALFTLPELLCLYWQFDMHPEKQVFGRTGVSGIRFFFWDSQFGRFFNTGPIKGSGDPFFYFHTLLWAFLPWSLLLYAAIIQKCRKSDGRRSRTSAEAGQAPKTEGRWRSGGKIGALTVRRVAQHGPMGDPAGWRGIQGDKICLGAALASFLVFSLSRFQLPHYLNILFPFFAIMTAEYLYGVRRRGSREAIGIIQDSVNILLPVLLWLICWFFHFDHWPLLMAGVAVLAILPFVLFRERALPSPIARSFWMAMIVFAFINFVLYPSILQYQAGTQAGKYVSRLPPTTTAAGMPAATDSVYLLQEGGDCYSFEFDCSRPVGRIPIDSLIPIIDRRPTLVFAPVRFADSFTALHLHPRPVRTFQNFHISQLTGPFIDYHTRSQVLTPWMLMEVTR